MNFEAGPVAGSKWQERGERSRHHAAPDVANPAGFILVGNPAISIITDLGEIDISDDEHILRNLDWTNPRICLTWQK